MPKSPKGSEHLYFNVVDRTDTSHQDAAKLIACSWSIWAVKMKVFSSIESHIRSVKYLESGGIC